MFKAFQSFSILATCLVHFNLLDLISLTILGEPLKATEQLIYFYFSHEDYTLLLNETLLKYLFCFEYLNLFNTIL